MKLVTIKIRHIDGPWIVWETSHYSTRAIAEIKENCRRNNIRCKVFYHNEDL